MPQGNTIRAADAIDENHIWFGTSAGVVMHTDDSGQTWSLQLRRENYDIQADCVYSQNLGWATGQAAYYYSLRMMVRIRRMSLKMRVWGREIVNNISIVDSSWVWIVGNYSLHTAKTVARPG